MHPPSKFLWSKSARESDEVKLEALNPFIVLFVIGGDALKLFSSHLPWNVLINIIKGHGGQGPGVFVSRASFKAL